MKWERKCLGELFQIKHGWAFKGEYFSSEGELIILTPGNFIEQGGFRQVAGKEKFYLGEFPEEYLLKKDDVVIAMTEQGPGLLGSPALVPTDDKYLHNQRIGFITEIDKGKIDKKYIYYLFFTANVRNEIFASATGTKVKHTAPKRIYSIEVNIPSLPTQRKIAAILSSYDDLIENNLRRIKLLEEKAFLRYKEIVRSEKMVLVDKLENIIQTVKRTPKILKSGYKEKGLYPIIDQSTDFIGGYTDDKESIYEDTPMIVFGDHTRILKYINFDFACGADGTQLIKPKNSNTSVAYLYFELISCNLSNYNYARHFKFLKEQIIKLPSEKVLIEYNEETECYFKFIQVLRLQNTKLREARDILLPRLMSGEIGV